MIERWIQITCDGCGDTLFSMEPNISVAEFRRDEVPKWTRHRGYDLCPECSSGKVSHKPR